MYSSIDCEYLSFIYPERGRFGEIFTRNDDNNIIIEGEYFAESPERRVYERFIIPKELNDKA